MARSRRRSRSRGKVIKVTKKSLVKRHRGAKFACLHPRSHRKSYHRTKRAANRACGKSRK